MVKVRGCVDNPDRLLKAEMFVTVDLASHQGKVLAVPSTAVFLQGERHYLFVQHAAGNFLRREVDIGGESDGRLVILKGLRPGEAVVTAGCMLLEQVFQQRR
jgi:multidrug efflux pump subunit AcrA (membrane-fusion protein)